MSSASVPNPLGGALPQRPPSRPEIVKPVPPRPRPRAMAWVLAAVAILGGVGFYLKRDRVQPENGGGGPGFAALRTAIVSSGELKRTVRLGGAIQAERFAALIAPQLHGSRGSFSGNRGGGRNSGSNASNVSAPSTTPSPSTNTIASSNTATSTSSSASASGASAGSSPASSLGTSRGSSNRFSDRSSASSPSSAAGASKSSTPASSTMGSGLGSTASAIPGNGGGGGGPGGGGPGGDFALVLMSLPNAGGHVKKGDPVAEFDRVNMLNRIEDYKDTVIQTEASIRNKKANLAVADEAHRQQIRAAKADMEKAKLDLQTLEVVSNIDAERLKLAAEETAARYKQLLKEVPLLAASQKADLRASELTRDQSKIELQKAVSNADRMILKAPMDGIAVMQSIRRGMEFGQAQPGDTIYPGQGFMQIVDPASMVMNANVNQVDTELLRIGMKATVHLDAYPGIELPAHVYSIGAVPVAGRRPNFMRQIPVRLKLDKIDPRVLPDLSASADIVLDSRPQAILAPLASILQDGPASKPFVFLRSADGWQKREVALGPRNNVMVAVNSGLSKGDVVALDAPDTPTASEPRQ